MARPGRRVVVLLAPFSLYIFENKEVTSTFGAYAHILDVPIRGVKCILRGAILQLTLIV